MEFSLSVLEWSQTGPWGEAAENGTASWASCPIYIGLCEAVEIALLPGILSDPEATLTSLFDIV